MLWSATAVFAPIAILIALYYRIAGFDRSIPFAGAAVVLAGAFALATEAIGKRGERPGSEAASAIFATGSIASLALALSLALEKGWLTVALALMVPGIAWVAEKRTWPWLRWLAAAVTIGVLGRIIWEPRIVGDALGTHAGVQLAALGLRRPGRILLARRPYAAAPGRRRAGQGDRRRRHSLHRDADRVRGAALPHAATRMARAARWPRPRSTCRSCSRW